MPFVTKNNYSYTKPNETLTIVQKETIVNEYKVDILNASLDSVCVKDLTITNKLIVPDITLFYRPNPHIFTESYLLFSNTANVVSFKNAEGQSFLNFDKTTNSVFTENLDCSSIACSTLHTETLYVDRIITSKGNEIGGVYLKNSTISVPQDANIGGHIVAKDANIGGCILRNKKGIFSELDVDSIHVKSSLSFTLPETIGGVILKNGSISTLSECILSGITLKNSLIGCEKININNNIFFVENSTFNIPVGIFTPHTSKNSIGVLEVSPSNVKIGSDLYVDSKILANVGEIKNVFSECLWIEHIAKVCGSVFEKNTLTVSFAKIDSISNKLIDCESIQCKTLSVSESFTVSNLNVEDSLSIGSDIKFSKDTVTAKDYTFLDGTSMKNDLLTRNMIVMFKGKKPPRGWVKCDGMFGTPLLLTYNEDVIYIMRT